MQYDLNTSPLNAVILETFDASVDLGTIQLGPDNKLYVAEHSASNSIGVINDPNNLGLSCDYTPNSISLEGGTCRYGLPTFYNTIYTSSTCDSTAVLNLTINSTTYSSIDISSCEAYTWNGNTYDTTGSYYFTTTNSNGCDSIATLNLTINQLDALGICNGDCTSDVDMDGVCDDIDDCVGEYDECGVCNGLGAVFECGCSNIPEGDCDCFGNQLDAIGICGGDCTSDVDNDGICDDVEGCTYADALNYNPIALIDNGTCIFEDCNLEDAYNEGFENGVDSVICPEDDCPGDYNNDGTVSTADLLQFLILFGTICPQ